MGTVKQVLSALKKSGNEQTRKTYLKHGAPDTTLGVKVADMKWVGKQIKGNQPLACELYESGNPDAMYLAGLLVDGTQLAKRELDRDHQVGVVPLTSAASLSLSTTSLGSSMPCFKACRW